MNPSLPASPRLAIVISHPIQYYSPWFRWLARDSGLALKVFYLWDAGVTEKPDPRFKATFAWDVDLLSGYESEFVPNASPTPGAESFGGFNNPALPSRLAEWKPDAMLLFGYKWRSHLRAVAWARSRGVPIIFRGDSHLLGRKLTAGRAILLRLLFRQFAAFLYVGAANRDYFSVLGAPAEKLFFAPHAVDPMLFDPAGESRQAAASLRAQLRVPVGGRVVLFAGKFVEAKQPVPLAEAFLSVRSGRDYLVMVGDGEQKPVLENLARTAPDGSIRLLPFANQSEMPARYLLADVFALPSRGNYETWGLAVNEAMQMGKPCLVSDRVGCQRDLVTDGETGWVFPADDPRRLREKLTEALSSDFDAFHDRVLNRISKYSYAAAATGLERALSSVAGRALRGPEGEAG